MARFLSQRACAAPEAMRCPSGRQATLVILRIVSDFRRAMDLSLVLDQEGIAHELRSLGEEQWALLVEDEGAERAAAAVAAFELENRPLPVPPEPVPVADGLAAALLFGLPLIAFQMWTGPQSDEAWFLRGSADAAAVLHGEWWRIVTALTLHADAGHAAGNAVIGGVFLALLARRVGTGFALALTLVAGICGTAFAAELVRRNFISVGASTAVFGALGALALLPGRRALQLAGAVALLGFLGTGKRADLAGHLCGFAFGVVFGFLASHLPVVRSRLLQFSLGLAAFALPAFAWLRVLR
jgi:rhomboid protease GluP